MYTVYCDNSILYTPGVEELKLGDPVLKLEVNKTGSFSFTIYPDHLYYDQIERMKSIVRVEKDGSMLFRGRVISEEIGLYGEKDVTCEGCLAFCWIAGSAPSPIQEPRRGSFGRSFPSTTRIWKTSRKSSFYREM